MVAWSDYKAQAKARGALACELFVVISTPSKPPEELKAILPDHLGYQQQLEQHGVLAFAGPLSDESGDNMEGTGMIVYRVANIDEARALADADPMHQQQARSYTIRKWLVNEGSMQLNVKLAAQSITLD